MARKKIPMRPVGEFKLKEEEKDALTYHIISGCDRVTAFSLFLNQNLALSRNALVMRAQQFFSDREARRYMEEYQQTLDCFFGEKLPEATTSEEKDRRLMMAKEKMKEYAINMANGINSAEEPDGVIKFWKDLGLLKDETEEVEQPRRYLPERCGECVYRCFVEGAVEKGDMVDECGVCRAMAYAKEHGYRDDPTRRLAVPKAAQGAEREKGGIKRV